jgi:hypothetical protein
MIQGNINNSPIRSVKGKVELYEGSTLLNTYSYRDNLASFVVDREGEGGKFFGFGICQKLTVKLVDKDREININTSHSFKAYLTTGEEYYTPYPEFLVTEVTRDENTNELTITAYDRLYNANAKYLGDISKEDTLFSMAKRCTLVLGITQLEEIIPGSGVFIPKAKVSTVNIPGDDAFYTFPYGNTNSFEEKELARDVLDDIAEASQSIYYINNDNTLIFKRLNKDGEADLDITKADYFTLKSEDQKVLATIARVTELGDNYEIPAEIEGITQYVRDNSFWERREDIAAILETSLAAIGGISIGVFECSWRGNFLLEPGDKIAITAKDGSIVTSYALKDTLTYNGALAQTSSWSFENTTTLPTNPTTLGESLKQTFAKVDKANKEITLLASDIKAKADEVDNISKLILDPEGILATVSSLQEATEDAIEGINGNIETLTQSVEAKMTDEDVTIKINEALSNGVDKVETSTGFTFNEEGLTVSKTDSEITTTITEDGMTVYKENEAVLTANNIGVDARNLHATTYLIIGTNSRFEDYGSDRTGCFWIGG